MTAFERAKEDYYDFFEEAYPCVIGVGYPGNSDRENIAIIRQCIRENKPLRYTPRFLDDVDYV